MQRILGGFHPVGTDEQWVTEEMTKQLSEMAVAVHFRRPLRIDEINRMA